MHKWLMYQITKNVKKSIEEITKTKKIDIFVNNAGITGLTAGLWDYPVKEWLKVLDINLNGTFYCCKSNCSSYDKK